MADIVDKKTRSRMMAAIRGKNTNPEIRLRRALHARGFRYRIHAAGLPGRPDIVLPRYHAVIQIHGCFWHRHRNCRFATTPGSNAPFWSSKFAKTVERDERNLKALRKLGWRVAVVWECLIDERGEAAIAQKVAQWLRSGRSVAELPSPSSM